VTTQSAGEHGTHAYSERLDRALMLAAAIHERQVRKGTAVPYIIHPYQVALILDRYGWSEDVVIAGALHDVLEDARCERPELRQRLRTICPGLATAPDDERGFRRALGRHIGETFGAAVLEIVAFVTEEKTTEQGERRPWKTRKVEQLEVLRGAGREVAALKAADVLHNAQSIARDLRTAGSSAMGRFNAPPDDILWHYRSMAALIGAALGADNPLARELGHVVADFEDALRGAR
jgi:(p)ppGpp synthase/HD superfamily hydrolase